MIKTFVSSMEKFKIFENISEREIRLFGIGVLLKSGKVTLEDIIEKAERDNERLRGTFSCHECICEKDSNKKNK